MKVNKLFTFVNELEIVLTLRRRQLINESVSWGLLPDWNKFMVKSLNEIWLIQSR
ncbi:MAG: hypothetical protein ACTS4V_01810 [Candidatus Hodgkinia cicadicola]